MVFEWLNLVKRGEASTQRSHNSLHITLFSLFWWGVSWVRTLSEWCWYKEKRWRCILNKGWRIGVGWGMDLVGAWLIDLIKIVVN
jgi:hypothetical protein